MDWFDVSGEPHTRTFAHGCRLSSLPTERERELAALWRLEADVNNGAYPQFIDNWGRESYVYASQALKKIGALQMASIIDQCQALVDEFQVSTPNGSDEPETVLPNTVWERVLDLSYKFMDYPDDIAMLGVAYYWPDASPVPPDEQQHG